MNIEISDEEFMEIIRMGVPVLDYQHFTLYNFFKKIQSIKENDNDNMFIELFIELNNNIFSHLKTEEEYMKKTGYKNFEAHKLAHDKVRTANTKILVDINNGLPNKILLRQIKDIAEMWFCKHYERVPGEIETDLNLVKHFRELDINQ